MANTPKPVTDYLDPTLPGFDPAHPAVKQAIKDWLRMNALAYRPGSRSKIHQVGENAWECQIAMLLKGKRITVAKERGNTPGTATDAAIIVASDPHALEEAARGHMLRLHDVRPDLPRAEELDGILEEESDAGQDADPEPSVSRATAPPQARRTRSNATALYEFVVETINADGDRQWKIADMLEAANAAGHETDNLRARVALRDAAKAEVIDRVGRGLYAKRRTS